MTPPGRDSEGWNPMHLSGPTRVLNAVCKEAQVETEKAYHKLAVYRRRDFTPGAIVTDAGEFPFNLGLDTLYARNKGHGEHGSYFIKILENQPEGHEIKRLSIFESRLREHNDRHLAVFMRLEELTIVAGTTPLATRTKALRPGFEINFENQSYGGPFWEGRSSHSGWWGRGSAAEHHARWSRLWNLMDELKTIEKEERLTMPTVRVMVLNEKEFRPRPYRNRGETRQ